MDNRTFSVKIRNAYSHEITLLFGVQQGSLLGPIIFILYTKEVTIIMEKYGLKVQVYANDHQLYIGFKKDDDSDTQITTDLVHCCLQEIKRWITENYLKINAGKTKFMAIGSQYNMRNNRIYPIKFFDESNGKELEKLDTILTLVVTIDSTISMKTFVNSKCSEAYFRLRNIDRLRPYLDTSLRTTLVSNLILSKLDYCNAILANVPDYLQAYDLSLM